MSRFNFKPSSLPPEAFDVKAIMAKFEIAEDVAREQIERMRAQRILLSDTYQVNVQDVDCHDFGTKLTWLSIKRRDKAAFHDWRELQQIKNAICGPEREAVEMYPAESRLVDTSNQYHLWVLPDGLKWPFGYMDRMVLTESKHGAVQRPFEQGE